MPAPFPAPCFPRPASTPSGTALCSPAHGASAICGPPSSSAPPPPTMPSRPPSPAPSNSPKKRSLASLQPQPRTRKQKCPQSNSQKSQPKNCHSERSAAQSKEPALPPHRPIPTKIEPVRVSDFHFDLPEELIAQTPPAVRGTS